MFEIDDTQLRAHGFVAPSGLFALPPFATVEFLPFVAGCRCHALVETPLARTLEEAAGIVQAFKSN